MRFIEQFMVHRSPEETYAYLLDVEHEAEWNPWAVDVQKTTPGPAREGTEFVGRYKRIGTARQRLTDCEPGQRVTYRADTMDGRMTFTLQPKDGGTMVELEAEAHPTGAQKLLAPLMTLVMRRHIADIAAGITRELEG
jgi:carbon monoxide dehydrogenase subunit G